MRIREKAPALLYQSHAFDDLSPQGRALGAREHEEFPRGFDKLSRRYDLWMRHGSLHEPDRNVPGGAQVPGNSGARR
jgi:hypothetical protein